MRDLFLNRKGKKWFVDKRRPKQTNSQNFIMKHWFFDTFLYVIKQTLQENYI